MVDLNKKTNEDINNIVQYFPSLGIYSTVTIELEEKPEHTLLKLKQTGVPDFDKVRTEQGWKQHFFGPIKQIFGYGASLF